MSYLTDTDLETIAREYIFVADISALTQEGSEKFFERLLPAVANHSMLFVSDYVLKKVENGEKIGILKMFSDADVLKVENMDTIEIVKRLSVENVALITCDSSLFEEVPKNVRVIFLMKDGDASLYNSGPFSPINYPVSSLIGDDYPVPPPTQLEVKEVPGEGDFVYLSSGERVKLVSKISSGGEGTIYETDVPNLVAKIYHRNRITADLKEKITAMVKLREFFKVDRKDFSIVWPEAVLFNSRREFVGYLMPRARGEPLQRICNATMLMRKYRHIKRSDLVKIAINTLKALDHLYSYRVLMGDVNQLNILVDEKLKVHLIDSDSYQIGPFVCKVGKPEFSHPDWIDRKYADNPRNPTSEAFALAILVFMILLPGKHPFAKVGGEGITDNIKQRFFPYAVKGTEVSSYDKAPAGYWRYIWSHTPPRIKEILHDILVGDREPQTYEELRAVVNELIYHLEKYRSEILSGERTDEVFPTYYFIPDYVPKKKLVCPKCKKTFEISMYSYERLSKMTTALTCHYCYTIEKAGRKLRLRRRRGETVIAPQRITTPQASRRVIRPRPRPQTQLHQRPQTQPVQAQPTIVVKQQSTPDTDRKRPISLIAAGAGIVAVGAGLGLPVLQLAGIVISGIGVVKLLKKA